MYFLLLNSRNIEAVCDSGSDCPIIAYEKAKKLDLKIDSKADNKSHENNLNYTMTEDDIKSVINEAMVKDNISRAGTVNVDPFQELRKSIKTATKSFIEQLNTIRMVSSIRRQRLTITYLLTVHIWLRANSVKRRDSETRDSLRNYKRDSKLKYFSKKSYTM
ncbi:hypothetical protein Glove_117g275 [Diversispora epigaea]|uniref:Uncharacterized protein n=1 Tax=Diversispora epigaea TaxID=1348612 RepID=A0A397J6K0_9GLOM|nr:hypothetical protein Glove_117g275 [Diversispora epigaea]